jgi:Nuclease-related domain
MRIVTLSDHPGDLLADAVSERQRGPAHQETALNDARRRRDQAWEHRRWFSWLRLVVATRRAARELSRQRLSAGRPTGREDSIRAGHDAEQRVADALGRTLDGDWALFRGYRNRRGEIDGLLLGPGGVFAYEVKYHNGPSPPRTPGVARALGGAEITESSAMSDPIKSFDESVLQTFPATFESLEQQGLLTPIVTLDGLRACLNADQRVIVDQIINLKPRDYGVNTPYAGDLEPVPADLVKVSGQQYAGGGVQKTLSDKYVPRHIFAAYVHMNDVFMAENRARKLLIQSATARPRIKLLSSSTGSSTAMPGISA